MRLCNFPYGSICINLHIICILTMDPKLYNRLQPSVLVLLCFFMDSYR